MKRHRALKITGLVLAGILIIIAVAFGWYVNDYYHADAKAQQAATDQGVYAEDLVRVEEADGQIAFVPADPFAGFIFYPGGKVEAGAYAPLLQDLAAEGVLCVLCPMPFNLAVFDIDAAEGVEARFPQVKDWYIGGHSLGGSMAAAYLATHSADFRGLVLLGSYSTEDLSGFDLRALLIRGSEDGVLNAGKYEENLINLPSDTEELVIAGGNHAQFGDYGAQDGDGNAAISADEQQEQTASAIAAWMKAQS